ncbi:TonB-dependent siderophore receptor [Sesbania bispinosa]|nr:TonB-dependent siderophore receptor [Sesbania bispinosa]
MAGVRYLELKRWTLIVKVRYAMTFSSSPRLESESISSPSELSMLTTGVRGLSLTTYRSWDFGRRGR